MTDKIFTDKSYVFVETSPPYRLCTPGCSGQEISLGYMYIQNPSTFGVKKGRLVRDYSDVTFVKILFGQGWLLSKVSSWPNEKTETDLCWGCGWLCASPKSGSQSRPGNNQLIILMLARNKQAKAVLQTPWQNCYGNCIGLFKWNVLQDWFGTILGRSEARPNRNIGLGTCTQVFICSCCKVPCSEKKKVVRSATPCIRIQHLSEL